MGPRGLACTYMDPIDQLPPDQSAVLSLLLRQGRSYADIADLLGIPQSAVRDRAHAALDAIAGGPPEASRRAVAGGPAPPHATARGPAEVSRRARQASPRSTGGSSAGGSSSQPAGSYGSRRAGALLLSAIVVVVVVAVVLIANSGGSSHNKAAASSTTTSTNATSSTAAGGPHVDKQLDLTSPDPSSSAVGLVEIVSEGSKRAFLVSAEHLAPTSGGFFYVAWLYNSPSDAVTLGRAPSVGSSGKLQAVGALPPNAGSFHTMLITRETSTHAKQPGPIVLSGAFSLG
jgi:Sigma-70, region 4